MHQSVEEKRLSLLKRELQLAGVRLRFANKKRKGSLPAGLLPELAYALCPPVHERWSPRYGAIVAWEHGPLPPSLGASSVVGDSLDDGRQLADGETSFLYCTPGARPTLACCERPVRDELDLCNLAQRGLRTVVQRDASGVVRVVTGEEVVLCQDRRWFWKPYARRALAQVTLAVPGADTTVLRHILEFSFHDLSPHNVGATFVWHLSEAEGEPRRLENEMSVADWGLRLGCMEHRGAIRQLLAQHDGAAGVAADGTLTAIGGKLRSAKETTELIPAERGTRHTSAKRYSFEDEESVLVVVSEDGPVSVYSDGARVGDLEVGRPGDAGRAMERYMPDRRGGIWTDMGTAQCGECKKWCMVEVMTVAGLRTEESGSCPVCDHEVVRAKATHVRTWPRKRLRGDGEPTVPL